MRKGSSNSRPWPGELAGSQSIPWWSFYSTGEPKSHSVVSCSTNCCIVLFKNVEDLRTKSICGRFIWLVVSTHLKNISQNGNLPQIGVKIKNVWNHHPVYHVEIKIHSKNNKSIHLHTSYRSSLHQTATPRVPYSHSVGKGITVHLRFPENHFFDTKVVSMVVSGSRKRWVIYCFLGGYILPTTF